MDKASIHNGAKIPNRKFGFSNSILILVLTLLLVGETYCAFRVYSLSREQEQTKQDYSIANNITFGLFSVEQWRDKIVSVVNRQVSDFSMSSAQKKALQKQIEKQLHALIKKTVAGIEKPQKTLSGKLKKIAFNAVVNTDDLQAQVPSFAKTIITKVNSPASKKRLKSIATTKIDQLEKETYDSTSFAKAQLTKHLFKKYQVSNSKQFNNHIDAKLRSSNKDLYNFTFMMFGCVLLALCIWVLMRKKVHLQNTLFIMSILFAFVLLVVGITASIIEVDARLQSLSFMLIGEKIAFENQVLFFQSKSIWEIVSALIKQPKPDAVLVGALILIFVIILPVLRLVAKGIHILANKKVAENKVVRYLAFQSGKWDMSDVMVVGILMTYIGLNGILKSQLSNLNFHNSLLDTNTVNYTSLQPGYFIFLGYVAFAMVLSFILKKIIPLDER